MLDKGIDTPVHFVDKHIDPNYCWNEWELRKKLDVRSKMIKLDHFARCWKDFMQKIAKFT